MPYYPNMRNKYFIISVMLLMYFLSYFFRVATAVIAPDLVKNFSINPSELGLLSSFYFYTFAVAQFFIGPLLDKKGPRKVGFGFGIIAASGAIIFAIAPSYNLSILGRALTGLGVSVAYMGTLKMISIWFKPNEFATMSSISMAVGNLGALLAATPLAFLAGLLGWRYTFGIFGIFTIASAFLILWLADDKYHSNIQTDLHPEKTEVSFLSIFKNRNFLIISFMEFAWFGGFISMQGLWGGPFLMDVYSLSKPQAGTILGMISIGFICGAPIIGFLSDEVLKSRKKIVILGLSVFVIVFFMILVKKWSSTLPLFVGFFIFGFSGATGAIGYAHIKELFPPHLSGTVMSYINFFAMFGAAFMQNILGVIISNYTPINGLYTFAQYKNSFMLCIILILVSVILYFFTTERKNI